MTGNQKDSYVGRDAEQANPTAVLDTTMGKIEVELFLDRVPRTASNFIDLARSGYYNGIHFHRVVPGCMDQFGYPHAKDPNSSMAGTGSPPDGTFQILKIGSTERRFGGGNIEDENISRDSNAPGTLSRANAGRPNSGGSQFFINVANNSNLDWFSPGASKHPVFSKIVSGYDDALAISKPPTRSHRPIMPIMMNSIQIREPELEEEVIALTEAEKDADGLRRASVERVLKGCVYHGTVEDIEQGKDSGERLYLIRYTDGDTEHLTADQVRQWSRAADGDASATQESGSCRATSQEREGGEDGRRNQDCAALARRRLPVAQKEHVLSSATARHHQVREQTVEMIKMNPQERLETLERKLAEEIVTERDLRIREAGDLRSAVESLHEHIEHLKLDTGTTLDGLERKLALETVA